MNAESHPSASPLAVRVEALEAQARRAGTEEYLDPSEIDYEAWNHVGDPLCEDLLGLMRDRKEMGGDLLGTTRQWAAEGVPEARAFLDDVETVPGWLDVDALRLGASLGKRNPLGIMIGIHGALPLTYLDPATAVVMGSTGRLARGGDFSRRFWETATGFVGALDVDGMMPGGQRWEQWVRIRFLHTMIRMGIHRSGQWPRYDQGAPISMLATAATTQIFGQYRVNILDMVGARATQEERDGFALMWRWVSRIEGADNQLLGRTHEEEREIQRRCTEALFGHSPDAERITADVVAGTASMTTFGRSLRLNHAIAREVLSPRIVGVAVDGDARTALGLAPDPVAERMVRVGAAGLRGFHQVTRLGPVRRLADRHGQRLLDRSVERGLGGVPPKFRGTPVAGQATDA